MTITHISSSTVVTQLIGAIAGPDWVLSPKSPEQLLENVDARVAGVFSVAIDGFSVDTLRQRTQEGVRVTSQVTIRHAWRSTIDDPIAAYVAFLDRSDALIKKVRGAVTSGLHLTVTGSATSTKEDRWYYGELVLAATHCLPLM